MRGRKVLVNQPGLNIFENTEKNAKQKTEEQDKKTDKAWLNEALYKTNTHSRFKPPVNDLKFSSLKHHSKRSRRQMSIKLQRQTRTLKKEKTIAKQMQK